MKKKDNGVKASTQADERIIGRNVDAAESTSRDNISDLSTN